MLGTFKRWTKLEDTKVG